MDSLERQLRRSTRSWQSFVGAVVTSSALFLAIAWTSIVTRDAPVESEPPLTYALPTPPPPTPDQPLTTPPMSSSFAEDFKFDPTTAGPPPEIPLDLLDIRLQVAADPALAVAIDMQRTFEVQKPENPDRYIIYDHDQVDEIPVWLHGPQPRIPDRLQRTKCYAHVFFVVTDKGRTDHIFILDTNDPEFGQNVKRAIAEWRFKPARKGGKNVKINAQQPVDYTPEFKSPFSL